MGLIFYYTPMSSATRVHWALEELGVAYDKVKLDLRAGDQRKPEFLRVNPNGKVPAIVDDGTPMFESLAILIHLGEKYGVAKKLWPEANTPARAEALTWTVWGTVTLGTQVFRVIQNTSERVPAEQRNAAAAEAARGEVRQCLQLLEGQLAGRTWLLTDGFTLADVANASVVAFASRAGVDLTGFPNVNAWAARCTQRPAMAVAAAG